MISRSMHGQAIRFTSSDVCRELPSDLTSVITNHSALAALLAGFSLTTFAVLLAWRPDRADRVGSADARVDQIHSTALILLLLAVVTGALASYLFSAISGDQCLNNVEEFNTPSVLLAMCGLLLLGGLAILLAERRAFGYASAAVQGLVVVLGTLIFIQVALDVDTSVSFMRNLRQLVPTANVTTLQAALNEVTAKKAGPHVVDPAGWVAERLTRDANSPHLFAWSRSAWAWWIAIPALFIWGALIPVRRHFRGSARLLRLWSLCASLLILGATLIMLVLFTVLEPTNTQIFSFPLAYEVFLLISLAGTAVVATTFPLPRKLE
jgi:hypothetical protein